ncbi:hypothetical protein QAD02_002818 [Eretmocerus hayati]|uniref:Uncharacterized protein n=1 Tax=Eretmocerus hayati TaxID=131215 RepID=A0ACC2NJX3_9HYME|nr:hypothetical protein QAD02_002818 [Eretmocerus hayati]
MYGVWFSKTENSKEEWLAAIDRKCFVKTSICSDHFSDSLYRPNEGYPSSRRLLRADAVPELIELHSSKPLSLEQSTRQDIQVSKLQVDEMRQLLPSEQSSRLSGQNEDQPQARTMKNNIIYSGRESVSPIVENFPTKIRFENGCRTVEVSEEQFTSQEAFRNILILLKTKNRKITALRRGVERSNEKISASEAIVEELESEKEFAFANHLKGLPPHFIGVIHRLKNHSYGPYSSHIKEFTRSLHLPAAYNMVQGKYGNCSPCIETLNRWYSSQDHKPGISEDAIKSVSRKINEEAKERNGRR